MSNTSETTDLRDLRLKHDALYCAIHIIRQHEPEYKITIRRLEQMRDEIDQQIKDAQFDQETNPLPFPEK